MPLSQAQVVSLYESLYPPGFTRWADFEPGSDFDLFVQALSAELLADGYNLLDTLSAEVNPATASQKLSDWEGVMGLGQTRTTLVGTVSQRQGQLVAASRSRGTPSIVLLQAILGPVLGYVNPSQLQILQHPRASVTALGVWIGTPVSVAIPPNASVSVTFLVKDAGACSQGGAKATFNITHPAVDKLTLGLEGPAPDNFSVNFSAGGIAQGGWTNDVGAAGGVGSNKTYTVGMQSFAGHSINGVWTLSVGDLSGNGGTLAVPSLFVEGFGRYVWNASLPAPDRFAEGLGALVHEFVVLVDPTLAGSAPDYPTVRSLLARATPAHNRSYLCFVQTTGAQQAVCGDANCIAGACIS